MNKLKQAVVLGMCLMLFGCDWGLTPTPDPEPDPGPVGPVLEHTDTTKRIYYDMVTGYPIYEFIFTQYQYDTKDELFLQIRNISGIARAFTYQINVLSTASGLFVYSYEDYNPGIAPGQTTEPLYISGTGCHLDFHNIWIGMLFY